MIVRACLAGGVALVTACAPSDRHSGGATATPRSDAAADAASAGGDSTMTTTCETARHAIAQRRFLGWRGLPAGCDPTALVGVGFDETWGLCKLGDKFQPVWMWLLK